MDETRKDNRNTNTYYLSTEDHNGPLVSKTKRVGVSLRPVEEVMVLKTLSSRQKTPGTAVTGSRCRQ